MTHYLALSWTCKKTCCHSSPTQILWNCTLIGERTALPVLWSTAAYSSSWSDPAHAVLATVHQDLQRTTLVRLLYCCGGYSILGMVWHYRIPQPVPWIGRVVWSICTYPFCPELSIWAHFSMLIKSTPLSQVVWFVQTKSCILPYHHQVYLVLILSGRTEWSNLQ